MSKIFEPNTNIIEHPLNRLQSLFSEWINSLEVKSKTFNKYTISKDDLFLNFNYTETLELAGVNPSQVCYIHGKRRSNEKLIVGHNSEYDYHDVVDDNESVRENNERIDKLDKLIEYKKKPNYNIERHSDFFDSLNEVDEVVVLGHSYCDVDIDYFKKVKECVPSNTKWILTWHSEEDRLNAQMFQHKLNLDVNKVKIVKDAIIYEQLES